MYGNQFMTGLSLALMLGATNLGCGEESPAQETDIVELMEIDSGPDAALPVPDAGPVLLEAPEAWVYENDPITDRGNLSRVEMHPSTSDEGLLTSEWVQVFNCLNEDGGLSAMPDFGGFPITISFCNEVQSVKPDEDGNYLSIEPPESDADPNDPFAEVMMYHHVNLVHDYFKDIHGYEEMDFPLPALVNVQIKTDPPIPFLQPGPDGWIGLSNAAFFPQESWELFAAQFGLPPRDSDSIIFFQGDKDFAYDARVIYHEYTHAVIGTERLQTRAVLDQYGLDNSAPSMNEGLADFFAASMADDPVIGAYVGVMDMGLRDLSQRRVCPDDTSDEIHAHGQLIGNTMWTVREAVGAEIAEGIVFRALEQFTVGTTHAIAAELIQSEADEISDEVSETVREIMADHGFGSCVRSRPYEAFNVARSRDRVPHVVEGKSSLGMGGFNDAVPAYKQFYIDVEAASSAIKLTWIQQPPQQAPGGFGGGGGQIPPLDLAVRVGEPIAVEAERFVSFVHDDRGEPPLNGQKQEVYLSGNCVPAEGGRIHTLFLNTKRDSAQIVSMQISTEDEIPADAFVLNCGLAENEEMPAPDGSDDQSADGSE